MNSRDEATARMVKRARATALAYATAIDRRDQEPGPVADEAAREQAKAAKDAAIAALHHAMMEICNPYTEEVRAGAGDSEADREEPTRAFRNHRCTMCVELALAGETAEVLYLQLTEDDGRSTPGQDIDELKHDSLTTEIRAAIQMALKYHMAAQQLAWTEPGLSPDPGEETASEVKMAESIIATEAARNTVETYLKMIFECNRTTGWQARLKSQDTALMYAETTRATVMRALDRASEVKSNHDANGSFEPEGCNFCEGLKASRNAVENAATALRLTQLTGDVQRRRNTLYTAGATFLAALKTANSGA